MDADAGKLLAGLCAGTGLSAACGFRVFVPLLAISVAVRFFGVSVGPDFAWIGSWMTLLVFATATLVETFAYCIPWVDNALDTVSTPLALAAGALAMIGMLPDLHPAVKWTVGLLLGTGAAGVTQLSTVALRATSSAATGGAGNCVVSTTESTSSLLLSILSFVLPVVALAVGLWLAVGLVLIGKKIRMGRKIRSKTGMPRCLSFLSS